MMKCGVVISSTTFPIPSYWPNSDLVKLNNVIWSLETQPRNIVVMKRVLDNSYAEIGRAFEYSKSWAFKEMEKIEKRIANYLNE